MLQEEENLEEVLKVVEEGEFRNEIPKVEMKVLDSQLAVGYRLFQLFSRIYRKDVELN